MTVPIADTRQAGGPTAADLAHFYGGTHDTGPGWVTFAGVMVGLAGFMNVVDGIAAIRDSKVFSTHAHVVLSNLHAWGWLVLALGVLELAAAFGILYRRSQTARWFGVAVVAANALAQLTFASAFPIWSLTVFGIDVLVIYALVVHGDHGGRRAPAT